VKGQSTALLAYVALKALSLLARARRSGQRGDGTYSRAGTALLGELRGLARTLTFMFIMPASFCTLHCWLSRRPEAAEKGLSVRQVQLCATACGLIGILFEHSAKWEKAAHIMVAAAL